MEPEDREDWESFKKSLYKCKNFKKFDVDTTGVNNLSEFVKTMNLNTKQIKKDISGEPELK